MGIGTTGPNANLEVATTGSMQLRLSSPGGSYRRIVFFDNATTPTKYNWEIAENEFGDGLFLGPSTAVGGMTFNTLVGFSIFPNGNVGIGTATPGQKLSVAGTIESTSGGFKFPDGTIQTTAVTTVSGKRYFRITLKNGTSGQTNIQLAELQFYDANIGQWITNNMTSDSVPSPKVVTYTPTSYSTSLGWKAFDGAGGTSHYYDGYMTSVANSVLTIDLGAGNVINATKYRVYTSSYGDGGGTYRPTDWTLRTSNDGVNWTILDSQIGATVPGGSYLEIDTTTS